MQVRGLRCSRTRLPRCARPENAAWRRSEGQCSCPASWQAQSPLEGSRQQAAALIDPGLPPMARGEPTCGCSAISPLSFSVSTDSDLKRRQGRANASFTLVHAFCPPLGSWYASSTSGSSQSAALLSACCSVAAGRGSGEAGAGLWPLAVVGASADVAAVVGSASASARTARRLARRAVKRLLASCRRRGPAREETAQ